MAHTATTATGPSAMSTSVLRSSEATVLADPYVALFEFEVVRGHDLPKMDLTGLSDPFCLLSFGVNKRFKTTIKKNTLNPEWKQSFATLVHQSEKGFHLHIECFDWDRTTKNDYIGCGTLELTGGWQHVGTWVEATVALTRKKKDATVPSGTIDMRFRVVDKALAEKLFWERFLAEFDTDHTATLDRNEVALILTTVGGTADTELIDALFAHADRDKSGSISTAEWLALVSDQNKPAALTRALPADPNYFWKALLAMSGGLSVSFHGLFAAYAGQSQLAEAQESEQHWTETKRIRVRNRATAQIEEERIPPYIRTSMRLMFANKVGRFTVSAQRLGRIFKTMTDMQERKYTAETSVGEIPHFVEYHNLNVDEIKLPRGGTWSRDGDKPLQDCFVHFNEFFYRELKPGARPIDHPADDAVAVSPADCRLGAFLSVGKAKEFWVKGRHFTIADLLRNDPAHTPFVDGTMVIARLAPQDYHRFHSPVTGTVVGAGHHNIDGTYYTVNPIAVRQEIDVYTENKRSWMLLRTKHFGDVLYVAIGATMVGSIHWTVTDGQEVKRGDELGYFAFGGSTCLVFFQPGRITLDEDLVLSSQQAMETLVRVGNSLGRATAPSA